MGKSYRWFARARWLDHLKQWRCGDGSIVVVVVVALAMALAVMVAVVMGLVWWSMMINDASDEDGRSMTTFVFPLQGRPAQSAHNPQ